MADFEPFSAGYYTLLIFNYYAYERTSVKRNARVRQAR